MKPGDWRHSLDRDQPCQIIATESLWGQTLYQVWFPGGQRMARYPADRLTDLQPDPKPERRNLAQYFTFVGAAARIADTLANAPLTAPLQSTVIPLPHQLQVLERAMSGKPTGEIRYLLADEVGLGKTIEAGLILSELKQRGRIRRILIVAPAGLVAQWVSEMKTHFNEDFRLVLPNHLTALRQVVSLDDHDNPWRHYDQAVCSLDSVKPLDKRRGWSAEQISQYNRDRFTNLVCAGWDLIIIDEAHRLGGSSKQVARYKLGDALAQATPHLLLLSATPHQGKTDAFRRLIRFISEYAVPDPAITREQIAPYVIRTEKRHAIDADGQPLFKPRFTQLLTVAWSARHQDQRTLYEAVTDYVRLGYNQARQAKQNAIGFLMILMQRLVTSSTAAIRAALERRLEVLQLPINQQELLSDDDLPDDWEALDGQEQFDTLLNARLKGLKNERAEVEVLLALARRCEAQGPDTKAETLLEEMQRLRREENDPSLKFLVFTEFVATQTVLADFLTQRGFSVVRLNGSLNLDERRDVQDRFAAEAEVLISTDAGGEGLNLQFCHIVTNYDLPWNPMKLEQRIGRVDRIGQGHVVQALNMVLEDTVELRVREVLEEKLQRILEEFGVDKLSDVLDSEEGGAPFEDLYLQAMLSPEQAEQRAEALAEYIRRQAETGRQRATLLSSQTDLDPAKARHLADHPLPYWLEQMVVAYLESRLDFGATVAREAIGYHLKWPDRHEIHHAVFTKAEAEQAGAVWVSLDDERVRKLLEQLPFHAPGQPIYPVILPGVSNKVSGFWSLWRISLPKPAERRQNLFAVFISDDGRTLTPTARTVWDGLIEGPDGLQVQGAPLSGATALDAYNASRQAAETQGAPIHTELVSAYQQRLDQWFSDREDLFRQSRALKCFETEANRKQKIRELRQELEREVNAILGLQRDGAPLLSWIELLDLDIQQFYVTHPVHPELTALLLLRIEREPPA